MGARTKFLPDLYVPSEYLTLWNILMAERQRDFFFFLMEILSQARVESWPGAERLKIAAFTFK